jgi:hypothetical protein
MRTSSKAISGYPSPAAGEKIVVHAVQIGAAAQKVLGHLLTLPSAA